MGDTEDQVTFDPNRRLCPDGNCIGVVGPDGRCAVCGVQAGPPDPNAPRAPIPKPANSGPAAAAGAGGGGSGGSDGFDPNRRLCDDGSCTGIVGPDGRCGECGRVAAG